MTYTRNFAKRTILEFLTARCTFTTVPRIAQVRSTRRSYRGTWLDGRESVLDL